MCSAGWQFSIENNGEIWAKLEAGTDGVLQAGRSDDDSVSANSGQHHGRRASAAAGDSSRCSCEINGEPPPAAELEAFCDRLNEITAAGGKIKLVQVYTVARRPAESFVAPLETGEVDAIVELVRRRTGLTAAGFYGVPVGTW